MFGAPESRNDLTIMDENTLFNDILNGKWPPIRPDSFICGYRLKMFYFIDDEIYPQCFSDALQHQHPKSINIHCSSLFRLKINQAILQCLISLVKYFIFAIKIEQSIGYALYFQVLQYF